MLEVTIQWGVKDLDRSDVSLWDSSTLGSLIWDDTFTLSPAENQQALLDLCEDLRDNFDRVKDKRVTCWAWDFDQFLQQNVGSEKKLPIEDEAEFEKLLSQFLLTPTG